MRLSRRLVEKLNKRNLFRLLAVFFTVLIFIPVLGFFAFYNDVSRKYIIDHVVSYLQNENFFLKIEGANKKLTYVDKVTVRFSGNLLEAYNINFERDGLFSRPRVHVKKVIFRTAEKESGEKGKLREKSGAVKKIVSDKGFDQKKSIESERLGNDSGFDFGTTLSYVRKVKLFVESLKITEALISLKDRDLKYEHLSYHSESDKDFFSMKMDRSQVDFVLDGSDSGTVKGTFRNIEGFSGNLFMNLLESSTPKYEVNVEKSEYKVSAKGAFADQMNTLVISQGQLQFYDKNLNFQGKVFLNKGKASLSTLLSLSNFVDISKIPTEITKNFQEILTNINIEAKEGGVRARIEFKKENRRLGNSEIVMQGKNLAIKSDVSWINFWGYRLKTFDVHSGNLKNFSLDLMGTDILGENIKIGSELVYDKNISIRKLTCDLKKGKITLVKPLVLSKQNLDTSFKFDFRSLGFLRKYFKVKGSVAGDLFLKDGLPGIDAKINRIINENYEIYNGKVSGDLNNLEIGIGSAKVVGNILKNVILKKKVTR